jgi:hypothetical protein
VGDPLEQTIRLEIASRGSKQSARYRQWAAEAEARAGDASSGEVRDAYRSLARTWLQMAADMEHKHLPF